MMDKTGITTAPGPNLQPIFDSIAEAITVTDPAGRITKANNASARLPGLKSSRDMIGRDVFELIADSDRARARKDLKKTLRSGAGGQFEYRLLHRNGREFPAELTVTALKGADGASQGLIFITRDITEQKHANEALRQSEHKYSP